MEVKSILESLCTVDGVTGALLVDADGQTAESVIKDEWDPDYVTHLSHNCINSGNKVAQMLNKAPLKQSYIEFEESSITLDLLKNGSILVLLASSGANLGRIRLEIRKTKKSIEKQLN